APYTGYLWTPNTANGTSGTYVTFPFTGSQVNALGQVAGVPLATQGTGPSALYTSSGGTQYIVPPGTGSGASGINGTGQVVGAASSGACLWNMTNGIRFLNDTTKFTILNGAGWNLVWAEGINDHGQIVGWGYNPAGSQRFYLLTPQ